jgi:hypothetical protein
VEQECVEEGEGPGQLVAHDDATHAQRDLVVRLQLRVAPLSLL